MSVVQRTLKRKLSSNKMDIIRNNTLCLRCGKKFKNLEVHVKSKKNICEPKLLDVTYQDMIHEYQDILDNIEQHKKRYELKKMLREEIKQEMLQQYGEEIREEIREELEEEIVNNNNKIMEDVIRESIREELLKEIKNCKEDLYIELEKRIPKHVHTKNNDFCS